EEGARQQVGPAGIRMNVFIKKLAAWDLMRTLGSENCGRVNQADAGALACYGTNHVIQLAVSAKAKSVEILRAHETLFGPAKSPIAQRQRAMRNWSSAY